VITASACHLNLRYIVPHYFAVMWYFLEIFVLMLFTIRMTRWQLVDKTLHIGVVNKKNFNYFHIL